MHSARLLQMVEESGNLGLALAREAGATLLVYELYPLGLPARTIPVMPLLVLPHLKAKRVGQPPVLFVHGLLHNASAFAWMRQKLAPRGFHLFEDVHLSTLRDSIEQMAQETKRAAQRMVEQTGCPKIDIVAHSMGGIVSRYLVQLLGGEELVRNLVTLGSPHQGTRATRLARYGAIAELSPDSETLRRLNASPLPRQTNCVAVSGDIDALMWPKDCAHWQGARNIPLAGVGHAGLLFSRRVANIIAAHLLPE